MSAYFGLVMLTSLLSGKEQQNGYKTYWKSEKDFWVKIRLVNLNRTKFSWRRWLIRQGWTAAFVDWLDLYNCLLVSSGWEEACGHQCFIAMKRSSCPTAYRVLNWLLTKSEMWCKIILKWEAMPRMKTYGKSDPRNTCFHWYFFFGAIPQSK